jgi:hypothetical protein
MGFKGAFSSDNPPACEGFYIEEKKSASGAGITILPAIPRPYDCGAGSILDRARSTDPSGKQQSLTQ